MNDAGDVSLIAKSIGEQIETRVPYLRNRVFGAVDAGAIMAWFRQPPPAVIVRMRDFAPRANTGRMGLPIARDYDVLWDAYVMATSFGPAGEGFFSGLPLGAAALNAGPGMGQLIRDVFKALIGFKADPEGGYDGARLDFLGSALDATLDGKIVHRMRWRHAVRWTGAIAS